LWRSPPGGDKHVRRVGRFMEVNVNELKVPTLLGEVAFQVEGPEHGVPIVLLPGLTLNSEDWPKSLRRQLRSEGFRLYRMDLPDTGASERMKSDFSWSELTQAVESAITQAVPGPCHLVGLSLGGLLLQKMDLVRLAPLSLTLLMTCASTYPVSFDGLKSLGKLLKVPLHHCEDRAFYESLAFREHLALRASESELREIRDRVYRSVERGWPYERGPQRQMKLALEFFSGTRPDFSHWTFPTLIIHGGQDPLLPVWSSRALHRQIPNSRFVVIEEMGHEFRESLSQILLLELLPHFQMDLAEVAV